MTRLLVAGILGAAMDHPHRPPPGVEVGTRMTFQGKGVARDQPVDASFYLPIMRTTPGDDEE